MKKNNTLKTGSVCIHLLGILFKFAGKKGIDVQTILSDVVLEPAALKDPDSRVSGVTFMQIWETISKACGNNDYFGLRLGSDLAHFPFSHIVFSVMLNDNRLLTALKNLIRYHHLMSDIISPQLFVRGKEVVFSIEAEAVELESARQYVDFIFAMVLTFLRYLSPRKLVPKTVRFAYEKPADSFCLDQLFGTKMVFGTDKHQMVFTKNSLESAIHLSDPDLFPLLEWQAKSKLMKFNKGDTWSQKVGTAIDAAMESRELRISTLSKSLGISSRTLQNRLREEGTSFRRIYEIRRREKAIALLENREIPIIDIAFLLGFSEQSAFNHAFKKWTGQPPLSYRPS